MKDASPSSSPETDGINTFSEKSLHHSLKHWYAQPGDRFEVEIKGSVIDLVRDDLLIEIQTANFSAMKRKLPRLLDSYRVHLVHPIATKRWIVKQGKDGKPVSRRKSPKKGSVYHVFSELVYLYPLMSHPNLTLEVLLIHDEEIRCDDGKGSWRRKGWSIYDRQLLEVAESYIFNHPLDFAHLLPDELPQHFTTSDLAKMCCGRRRVAQQMAYCLRHMDIIQVVEKRGNALVYALAP